MAMDAAFSPHRNPGDDAAAKTGAKTTTSGVNLTSGSGVDGEQNVAAAPSARGGGGGTVTQVTPSPRSGVGVGVSVGPAASKTASASILPSLPESKAVPVSKKAFLLR